MYKYTLPYEDYMGNKRIEDFRFNLTKQEMTTLQFDLIGENGDFETVILKIISEQDQNKLMSIFKAIIDKSYGELSADGKYFFKDEEILRKFKATPAYSEIYMKLGTDSAFASDFIKGIFPSELSKGADANRKDVEAKIMQYVPTEENTTEASTPALTEVK